MRPDLTQPVERPISIAIKRGLDITLAIIAMLVLAPLLMVIALAIKADGGPVLFRQDRVGRDGVIFKCLKFRSMVVDAEARLQAIIKADPDKAAQWKAYQKLSDDPRITGVGYIIRKTNLDELPQLINVLKGDMSLVGPRPMTVPQIGEYGSQYRAYICVRPGITGFWQTNGRHQTTFHERARLDAWYVRNWSLWRDMVILVLTVREVLLARGS